MTLGAKAVQRTYLLLMLGNTLATSFIWGINTIFLLDAGLSNLEAFAANAFFTLGMLVFEVPTGVVADTRGRKTSFMLGAFTLLVTTALYLLLWEYHGPFWAWALVSAGLGLGYTFFSGAVEAWLVDALAFTGFKGELDSVFAKGQIVSGVAMLTGSVAGGYIAQITNLGVPYVLRSIVLGLTLLLAFILMKDLGFKPVKSKRPAKEIKNILDNSIKYGLRNPPVRWLMLASIFTGGVGFYAFYAMQPYLLELYGDPTAYGIAGLAAAIVAGAQIAGGFAAPFMRKLFQRRTSAVLFGGIVSTLALLLSGLILNFWIVLFLIVIWGLMFAAIMPIRQAYINGLIPSKQRATILSFDSLMGSTGGVVTQPALGRVADVNGYASSYVVGAVVEAAALPFLWRAKAENVKADLKKNEIKQPSEAVPSTVTKD